MAIVIAFVVAQIVDRVIAKRGAKVGELVTRGELSPAAQTRLGLIRRLTFVGIVLIGSAIAALQIPEASNIATGLLASSAVLGLVIGFAAPDAGQRDRGILLALTQPIRIGDLVTFEEQTGEVEDMKLTYTYIRLDDGRRPDRPERVAGAEFGAEPHHPRPARPGGGVGVAADRRGPRKGHGAGPGRPEGHRSVGRRGGQGGARLTATMWASSPAERGKKAAELRLRWLRELREHALSSTEA